MSDHTKVVVGIDVSKDKLDVACSHAARVRTFATTQAGLQRLLTFLKKENPERVCLEATGGYERTLVETLHQHEFILSIVNPRQIRDFARACNQLAKTDAIDGEHHRPIRRTHAPADHAAGPQKPQKTARSDLA